MAIVDDFEAVIQRVDAGGFGRAANVRRDKHLWFRGDGHVGPFVVLVLQNLWRGRSVSLYARLRSP